VCGLCIAMTVVSCASAAQDASTPPPERETLTATPSPTTPSCTGSISGAISLTKECEATGAQFHPTSGSVGIVATRAGRERRIFKVIVYLDHGPRVGTFVKSARLSGARVELGGDVWEARSSPTENVGSFKLDVTSVRPAKPVDDLEVFEVHGTFDAQLVHVGPSARADDEPVALHVDF
jgi:hypothetical protein